MTTNTQVLELLITAKNTTADQFAALNTQLSGIDAKIASTDNQLAAMNAKFLQSEAAAKKAGVGWQSAARDMALFGVAADAVIYGASKMAAHFQQDMEMIHTQAGASQKEVDSLSSSVMKLSDSVGTGPDQLAQGLYHVESAGFRGAKALDMVHAAAEGAKIGNADLQSTTQAMIAVNASHIAGVHGQIDAMAQLNAIVGSGDMRMQGLTQAMSTGLLPAAHTAGLSLRDVGAALATVTDNATPPMEAATRLRMTIALLADPSRAAAKALEAVGLSASQANAELAHRDELSKYGIHLTDLASDLRKPDGLLVAVRDLKTHLQDAGLTATEQGAVLARAFGGGRSSAVIETLVGQIDRLGSKYKEQALQATKFGDDWNKTTQTTAFQAAQARANFDALGITVGQAVVPAVTEFLKVVTPAEEGLAHFVSDHKTLSGDVLAAAGALGGVTALVLGLSKVKTAYDAIKVAAFAARDAEIAAVLGPVAIVGIPAAYTAGKLQGNTDIERQNSLLQAQHDLTKAFDEGRLSESQAKEVLKQLDALAQITGTHIRDLTFAKLEDSKVRYQDHIQSEANALHHLTDELVGNAITWTRAADAKRQFYQFDGKSTPGTPSPAAYNIQSDLKQANADLTKAAIQVAADLHNFGVALPPHQAALDADRQKVISLTAEWDRLTSTSKAVRSALSSQDQYTKDSSAASNRLTAIQHQIADEEARGIPVTRAQWEELGKATEGSKRFTDALSGLEGKVTHTASALQLLDAAVLKGTATQELYDKAAQAQVKTKEKTELLAKAFDKLSISVGDYSSFFSHEGQRLNDALQNTEGKLAYDSSKNAPHSVIAADEASVKKAGQALSEFQAGTYRGTVAVEKHAAALEKAKDKIEAHAEAVQDAAEKRYAALLTRVGTADRGRPGVQGPETAYRSGQYNLRQSPPGFPNFSDYPTYGAAETAQAKYEKRTSLDFYHRFPSEVSTLTPKEMKIEGITPAQLLKDSTVVAYLETLTEKKLKTMGFSATQLATIPGTDEFNAKARKPLDKLIGGPDATNDTTGVKVVPGSIHGVGDAWSTTIPVAKTLVESLTAITTKINGDMAEAIAGATIDLIQHGAATKGDIDAINKSAVSSEASSYATARAADIQAAAMMDAAKAAGHYADYATGKKTIDDKAVTTSFDSITGAIESGIPVTQAMIQSWRDAKKAQDDDAAAIIKTSLAVGDLATAFGALSSKHTSDLTNSFNAIAGAYQNGLPVVQSMIDSWYQNKAATDADTAAKDKALADTSQWGALLSSITSQIGQGATDSQAKVTLDVLAGNTSAFKADTESAIAHRQAQEALTAATWDAQYMTANAATQSQMRSSLSSPMVSQQSTIQGLDSAVFNAKLSVIAARSAVQVSLLQAEVTATQNLAGIVTATAGVHTAIFNKQLSAINDTIPIMNDNNAIAQDLKAGNALQLQVDKQQLLIDRTTAQMDQVMGQWQITLAEDALKQAQDKMMVDQMNAEAAYVVAVDNLTLAQDNVTLQQATQQIGLDQLTVQTDISTSLGSVVDYLNMIDGDLQNLQAAQDQIQTDQTNLANDTSSQNIIAQQGQGILAGDTLMTAGDTAASQQAQQAYELQIAQYKVELNHYNLAVKDSQTNGQSVAALQAMVRALQAMIVNLHSPAGKAVMAAGVGGNTLANLQTSFARSAATTQLPMGFS